MSTSNTVLHMEQNEPQQSSGWNRPYRGSDCQGLTRYQYRRVAHRAFAVAALNSNMAGTFHDQDNEHDGTDPVSDSVHHNSWSANLEHPGHAANRELLLEEAVEAIHNIASGYHVNLVTHGEHSHPSEYLHPRLQDLESELEIEWEYIEQCGCGGHVTRVSVS